eukprot:g1040.t1
MATPDTQRKRRDSEDPPGFETPKGFKAAISEKPDLKPSPWHKTRRTLSSPAHALSPEKFTKLDSCKICDTGFGVRVRRHHCRLCGQSACDAHCQSRMNMLVSGKNQPCRVCDQCVESLMLKDEQVSRLSKLIDAMSDGFERDLADAEAKHGDERSTIISSHEKYVAALKDSHANVLDEQEKAMVKTQRDIQRRGEEAVRKLNETHEANLRAAADEMNVHRNVAKQRAEALESANNALEDSKKAFEKEREDAASKLGAAESTHAKMLGSVEANAQRELESERARLVTEVKGRDKICENALCMLRDARSRFEECELEYKAETEALQSEETSLRSTIESERRAGDMLRNAVETYRSQLVDSKRVLEDARSTAKEEESIARSRAADFEGRLEEAKEALNTGRVEAEQQRRVVEARFDAIQKQTLKNHESELEQTRSTIEKEAEIRELERAGAEQRELQHKFDSKTDIMRKAHERALEDAKDSLMRDFQRQLSDATRNHADAMERQRVAIRAAHEHEIESLSSKHPDYFEALERQKSEMRGEYDRRVAEAKRLEALECARKHEDEMRACKSSHQGTLDDLMKRGIQELDAMKADHEASIARIRAECEEVRKGGDSPPTKKTGVSSKSRSPPPRRTDVVSLASKQSVSERVEATRRPAPTRPSAEADQACQCVVS